MRKPLEVLRLYPEHNNTLMGLFESRAARESQRPLLDFGERHHTWASFGDEIARLTSLLHFKGVGKGNRIAIVATNSDAHVILLFALARLGAAMVPLNPSFGVAELAYVLGHAEVSGVVGSATTMPIIIEALSQTNSPPWLMRVDAAQGDPQDLYAPPPASPTAPTTGESDDTCLIIYTSGTTGLPKGVMHSQASYVSIAEVSAGRTGLQPDDRVLIILPFFHVNALFYSLGSIFAAGASGTILPKFSATSFWNDVVETRSTQVNIIEAVGNILQKRSRTEFRPDHKLRMVYGVREAFIETFRQEFGVPKLVTGFGMTECPGVICNPLEGPTKPGSMGVLGTHPDTSRRWTEARVVNDDGNDVPAGDVGELWLKSPTLMQGYFRDPVQTRTAYREGWFMTGDYVRRDVEGFFFFVSRKKDIIRRRGENISGAELDRVIGEHPAVYEAAAVAVPADLGEDEILAAVVLKNGAQLEPRDIAQWCRERLAPMKVPRYVLFLRELPHTPTHKVSKAALRADPTLRERATDLEAQG